MSFSVINLLLTLKNNSSSKNEQIKIKFSKKMIPIVECLYLEGIIQTFKILDNKYFYIILRYSYDKNTLSNLKLISTPSKTKIITKNQLKLFNFKKFIVFISTTEGIKTLLHCKKKKLGGKLLFTC